VQLLTRVIIVPGIYAPGVYAPGIYAPGWGRCTIEFPINIQCCNAYTKEPLLHT